MWRRTREKAMSQCHMDRRYLLRKPKQMAHSHFKGSPEAGSGSAANHRENLGCSAVYFTGCRDRRWATLASPTVDRLLGYGGGMWKCRDCSSGIVVPVLCTVLSCRDGLDVSHRRKPAMTSAHPNILER